MNLIVSAQQSNGMVSVKEVSPGQSYITDCTKPIADKLNSITAMQDHFFQLEDNTYAKDLELSLINGKIIDGKRNMQPNYIEIQPINELYYKPTEKINISGNIVPNTEYMKTIEITIADQQKIVPIFIKANEENMISINNAPIINGKCNLNEQEINVDLNLIKGGNETNLKFTQDGIPMQTFTLLANNANGTVFACYTKNAKIPVAQLNFYRSPISNRMSYNASYDTYNSTVDSQDCISVTGNLGIPGQLLYPDLQKVQQTVTKQSENEAINAALYSLNNRAGPYTRS